MVVLTYVFDEPETCSEINN